jgi:hypothetical protein
MGKETVRESRSPLQDDASVSRRPSLGALDPGGGAMLRQGHEGILRWPRTLAAGA